MAMASLFPTSVHHCRTSIQSLPSHFNLLSSSINRKPFSPIHLHRSFSGSLSNRSRSFLQASPDPPPSPPGIEPQHSTGIAATFSRVWDTVQIFFAVLFWMSLFFWASASDRKNSGSNKSDIFRK